jgi:hypothetical protein
MARMKSARPARKVVASSLASAFATIVIWALQDLAGIPVPAPVQASMVTLITFAAGYLVPPSEFDGIA